MLAVEDHPPGFWVVFFLFLPFPSPKSLPKCFLPASFQLGGLMVSVLQDDAIPRSSSICSALEVGQLPPWGRTGRADSKQGLSVSFVFGPRVPGRAVLLQYREREGLASSTGSCGISLV